MVFPVVTDGALELGDVGQELAARVHGDRLVDVVAQLGRAAEILLEPIVAGVDDEGHSQDHDQGEHAGEQQAARLTGGDPTTRPSRACHLLRG